MFLLRTVSVVVLAALVAGCGGTKTVSPVLEDYNVLLIVVDTAGARHIGCYNNELSHTPRIDELAEKSVRFENAYAVSPWTQPSIASILTGVMPSTHGMMQIGNRLGEVPTLAQMLKKRGYATAAVVSHTLVKGRYGYNRGYDKYDQSAISGHRGITSKKVSDRAIKWLNENGSRRFHLFLHYFDPHYVYRHHPKFDLTSGYDGPLEQGMQIWALRNQRDSLTKEDIEFLVGLYHEEIAFTDFHIGRVLDCLDELGVADNTIVILVADHGEEFMEHGWIGHTRTLYNDLIHVPMLIYVPGITKPAVVESPVSQIDILPTLMALSERNPIPECEGRALKSILQGGDLAEADIVAEVSFIPRMKNQPGIEEKVAFKTALIRGDSKVIHDEITDTWEYFDLSDDPGEFSPVEPAEADGGEDMVETLMAWAESRKIQPKSEPPSDVDISPEDEEQLRSLGYIR